MVTAHKSAQLPVNEIFETIQGEATYTGTPSVFIRLQGCDVGCPWCDTKHTWGTDALNVIPFDTMRFKTNDSPTYALATVNQLVDWCRDRSRHVVITGGEPCVHDLRELTGALIDTGKSVQIETSGTEEVLAHDATWVTVSPKIGMPGGLAVRPSALERASEIKMPVGRPLDVQALDDLLSTSGSQPLGPRGGVWLQPLSASAKATALCVSEAIGRGWKVSLQTHKFMGVR